MSLVDVVGLLVVFTEDEDLAVDLTVEVDFVVAADLLLPTIVGTLETTLPRDGVRSGTDGRACDCVVCATVLVGDGSGEVVFAVGSEGVVFVEVVWGAEVEDVVLVDEVVEVLCFVDEEDVVVVEVDLVEVEVLEVDVVTEDWVEVEERDVVEVTDETDETDEADETVDLDATEEAAMEDETAAVDETAAADETEVTDETVWVLLTTLLPPV